MTQALTPSLSQGERGDDRTSPTHFFREDVSYQAQSHDIRKKDDRVVDDETVGDPQCGAGGGHAEGAGRELLHLLCAIDMERLRKHGEGGQESGGVSKDVGRVHGVERRVGKVAKRRCELPRQYHIS